MLILETPTTRATIRMKGAELCSLYHKETETEYIWDANPDFWSKHSPILFPIVGTLKNDTFLYKGVPYTLPRHGFARDMIFTAEQNNSAQATFSLHATDETLSRYPFLFGLKVQYTLTNNELDVQYVVENLGTETMYFSIGGHPAFKVPICDTLHFEDYALHFETAEHTDIFPLTPSGFLSAQGLPYLRGTNILPLRKPMFYDDALIFKQLKSKKVKICSAKDPRYIEVSYEAFPYLGIWSKKDADFVCIEPWQGITDPERSSGLLEEKEGICTLPAGQIWTGSWQVLFS